MDIMRMQRSHKTSSDSPIHERDKNIISYRNARERESTYRDYQIVELAPPGYPLVSLGTSLIGMVTRATGMGN